MRCCSRPLHTASASASASLWSPHRLLLLGVALGQGLLCDGLLVGAVREEETVEEEEGDEEEDPEQGTQHEGDENMHGRQQVVLTGKRLGSGG